MILLHTTRVKIRVQKITGVKFKSAKKLGLSETELLVFIGSTESEKWDLNLIL